MKEGTSAAIQAGNKSFIWSLGMKVGTKYLKKTAIAVISSKFEKFLANLF